jgi:hypothetical protein
LKLDLVGRDFVRLATIVDVMLQQLLTRRLWLDWGRCGSTLSGCRG